jgi:hypothetical protein
VSRNEGTHKTNIAEADNMLLDNPDMPVAAEDQGPSLSQTVKYVDEFSF